MPNDGCHLEHIDNVTLLQMVGQLGTCQKSNVYTPLIQWDNVTNHSTCKTGTGWLPYTSQVMAVLELGFNEISRVSTYHEAPHWGPISVVGFTFSLTGRWLEALGPWHLD